MPKVNSRIAEVSGARENLHFARFDTDSAPVRSSSPLPPIKESEASEAYVNTKDWHYAVFDMSNEEEKKHGLTLQQVMNACANGWFILTGRQRYEHFGEDNELKLSMYVEWIEPYKELNPRFSDRPNSTGTIGKDAYHTIS